MKLKAFSTCCMFRVVEDSETTDREENAMKSFIQKHEKDVMGSLSGFDRLVFRGTLRRLSFGEGMSMYLSFAKVLLKDFAKHVIEVTTRIKAASLTLAERTLRPVKYLQSSQVHKEDLAREIAARDNISDGLICVLTCVEPCQSFEIYRNKQAKILEIQPRFRKCLHIYHYFFHPQFGFMSARIQTWFPLTIQVCINGRESLSRQMDKQGMRYQQRGNCFTWIEDLSGAQELMNGVLRSSWPLLLNEIAEQLNPIHHELFGGFNLQYYWSVHQSEWATDILFNDPEKLAEIYPHLLRHGMTTFASPDVMRFLGRNIPPNGCIPPAFKGEVITHLKKRPEGIRIKHWVGTNHIKLYDKQGSNLRVETTINDPHDFKVFRPKEGDSTGKSDWRILRKGVADLHRRAQVSDAANKRYLEALSCANDTTSLGALTEKLCRPANWNGKRVRALNPYAPEDLTLLKAVARGEFTINGFRNRDLRNILYRPDQQLTEKQKRYQAGAVTRKIRLLRAHGLIKKVQKTNRYLLTTKGYKTITALIAALNASSESLIKSAA